MKKLNYSLALLVFTAMLASCSISPFEEPELILNTHQLNFQHGEREKEVRVICSVPFAAERLSIVCPFWADYSVSELGDTGNVLIKVKLDAPINQIRKGNVRIAFKDQEEKVAIIQESVKDE